MISSVTKFFGRCMCNVPTRLILAIMGFFAVINAYTMRACLNIAITEMAIKVKVDPKFDADTCPSGNTTSGGITLTGETFDWSEELQGVILGAFFWGYVLTHIPGGILAEKYGGKYTLSLGILSTAIFTLLTPLAIHTGGAPLLIALRILEGLGEGTTFPALNCLIAAWIPLKERSKAGALVYGGAQIGNIAANTISGLLLHNFDGWATPFYFFGACGVLWFICFQFLCYKDPESHPYITEREKAYLKQELGELQRDKTLPSTPWRLILTSVPLMALVTAQIGHGFGYFTIVTDLPKYMSDVMRFNVKENGIYSSMPYVAMWVSSIMFGCFSDWIIKKKFISVTNSRKLFTTLAFTIPAIFIVSASYAGCDRITAVILFTVAMGFMGAYYSGMKVNALDLSPNYAGALMAIVNGIGAITGIIAPYLVGILTPNRTLTEWRLVFWISFGVFVFTNLVYVIWSTGKTQPWNTPHLMNKSIEEATPEEEKSTKTIT